MHLLGITSCPLRKRVSSSAFNFTIKPRAVLQPTMSLCKKFQILTILKTIFEYQVWYNILLIYTYYPLL